MSWFSRRIAAGAPVERLDGRLSRWLLIAVVVLSVQALGSIPPLALLAIAGLATLSAATALLGRRFAFSALPAPAWLILGLTAYTLLQALRLPSALVGWVAPANREVWDGVYELLGEAAPSFIPLSLDPGATFLEVVKGWLYLCVFVAAAATGARRGAGYGAGVVVTSSALLAVVCIAHGLSDATRVFGLYTSSMRGSGFAIAPLLNLNNRASYLNLGVICAGSLLAMPRPPLPRWLVIILIPPMMAVSVLTGSRGGLLGLFAGLGLLLLLLWRKLRHQREALPGRQLLALSAGLLAVGAVFAAVAAGPKLRHLLLTQNSAKLTVIALSLGLVPAHLWTGIGRGAFESVFPALHGAVDNTVASHPENFPVQWLTEWGVPVGLAALVGLAILLRPRNWGVKGSIPACGLFCAVASLAVQNLVDLGTEVPGIMVAGAAAAGFAWGAREGKPNRSSARFGWTLLTLGVGSLLIWLGARYGLDTLASDRAWLRERRTSGASWESFRADTRSVMLRHPAEPYFPRLAAVAAWKSGKANPLPWIGRALSRGLEAGRTHYLLGGYLASRDKHAQALLELRLAATYDPALSAVVARLIVQITRDEAELKRAAPEGPAGVRLLLSLAKNLTSEPAVATAILREAVVRDPSSLPARLALTRRLLDDVDASGATCVDKSACLQEASKLLAGSATPSRADSAAELVKLRARVLMGSGKPDEAARLLADECRRSERAIPCIGNWVEAARRAGDKKSLHQAVLALESEDCSAAKSCSAIFWAAGQAAVALGDVSFGLRYLERAATSERSAARWLAVARLARANGQPGRAANAFARARSLDPSLAATDPGHDSTRHDAIEQLLRK